MSYRTVHYAISISAILILLFNLNLNRIGLAPYIDIPSIVFVAIAIVLSKLLNEKSQSSFLLGIGLFLIALASLGIFATVVSYNYTYDDTSDSNQSGSINEDEIVQKVSLVKFISNKFYQANSKKVA